MTWLPKIYNELRQRNVFKALALYAGFAWALIGALDIFLPLFDVPETVLPIAIIFAAIGAPVVLLVSWFYDLTADGWVRDNVQSSTAGRVSWLSSRSASAAIFVLLAGALGLSIYGNVTSAVVIERTEVLNNLRAHIDDDNYLASYTAALVHWENLKDDAEFIQLFEESTAPINLLTEPAGATVMVAPYGTADPSLYQYFATTPIEGKRYAKGTFQWRIEKEGLPPTIRVEANPGYLFGRETTAFGDAFFAPESVVILTDHPTGTVRIPAKKAQPYLPNALFGVAGTGEDQASFLIGKHEVTNEDFAEFVNANGYTDPQLWLDRFEDEDRELDFDAAMQRFTDRTGRQGPAAWEYGTYPDGRGDYPVLGISWFEARAYARFRGADLPTLHQFTTAAYSPVEVNAPIRPFVIPQSQFSSADSRPVLQSQAMGPYGAYDLTGNAREWVINSTQDTAIRYTLGGSWKDPNYTSTMPFRAKAWDRSEANGMRLVFNDSAPSERARAPISSSLGDYDFTDHPLDDPERFNDVLWQFEAPAIPLKTELIPHAAAEEEGFKVLSFAVGDGRERMLIAIQLPTHGTPPYQPVIYFPGNSHFGPGFEFERDFAKQFPAPSYVVKGGRALIYAEYYGSYGRYDSFYLQPVEDRSALVLKRRMRWVEEVGRIIDYLETDKQIDASKVAYLGASFGATFPLPVLALEKRLKAAVLVVGGFSASDTGRDRSPIANITNYVSRITLPTLMLNGRFDYMYKEHHQVRPLFNLIATPETHKRLVMYDSGHWPLPENQMISEVLTWLDTYLGPVNTQAAAIVQKERPDS